jgi:hypothetical protein
VFVFAGHQRICDLANGVPIRPAGGVDVDDTTFCCPLPGSADWRTVINGSVASPGRRPRAGGGRIVHARSTTVQAQTSSIDAGMTHIRAEVMPAVQAMDGCVGISMLVDRASGRCIITTAWDTEEEMDASAEKARQLRDRAAAELGGNIEKVEEWQIAVLHRDHHAGAGAWARVMWVKVDAGLWDQSHEYFKTSVLPDLQKLDGFCSSSLLVNQATGVSVTTATYDSREALDRNREEALAQKRAQMPKEGAQDLDEGEFELALAHLRVPESV